MLKWILNQEGTCIFLGQAGSLHFVIGQDTQLSLYQFIKLLVLSTCSLSLPVPLLSHSQHSINTPQKITMWHLCQCLKNCFFNCIRNKKGEWDLYSCRCQHEQFFAGFLSNCLCWYVTAKNNSHFSAAVPIHELNVLNKPPALFAKGLITVTLRKRVGALH